MKAAWFPEARFGMFIHWGLYSIPGGIWQGREMEYIGEWLQSRFRIPNREYETLASRFNPERFDADAWCRTARDAGMRYLVFSAKHHDGFAMFHSRVDSYNVVDATPFGRDPLQELAASCRKFGLKLGIYYSQDLDWHHPDGGDPGPDAPKNHGMSWGNDWDFPEYPVKNFRRYLDGKVIPQLKELLTGYGEISIFWFDCPLTISRSESEEIVALIRKLQPACLINTRIGHGFGDYGSFGDNQLPDACRDGLWETPGTLNRTWGFKWNDHDWMSPHDVLSLLASLAEKNTNYLLNVGPRPDGAFPEAALSVLHSAGEWLRQYGFAVYGCAPNPFPHPFAWGYVTVERREGADTWLHLILRNWQPELRLNGLRENVRGCYTVTGNDREEVRFVQAREEGGLVVYPPEWMKERLLPVVTLEFAGCEMPKIDAALIPLEGVLHLPAARGTVVHGAEGEGTATTGLRGFGAAGERHTAVPHSRLSRTGCLEEWHNPADRIEWEANFPESGRYRVEVETVSAIHGAEWKTGQLVELTFRGEQDPAETLTAKLNGVPESSSPSCCYRRGSAVAGIVTPAAGACRISLRMLACPDRGALLMALTEVRLVRL